MSKSSFGRYYYYYIMMNINKNEKNNIYYNNYSCLSFILIMSNTLDTQALILNQITPQTNIATYPNVKESIIAFKEKLADLFMVCCLIEQSQFTENFPEGEKTRLLGIKDACQNEITFYTHMMFNFQYVNQTPVLI